jgi:hypothetical protein
MNFRKLFDIIIKPKNIYIFYLSQRIQNFFHRNYWFC